MKPTKRLRLVLTKYNVPMTPQATESPGEKYFTSTTKRPGNNPLGLYAAYQLYENRIYERLIHAFGLENVYVLSAGSGLIGAGFLTPYYDIIFSPSAEEYKRRMADAYRDFCMLPDGKSEVVFIGGRDYVPCPVRLRPAEEVRKPSFTTQLFLQTCRGVRRSDFQHPRGQTGTTNAQKLSLMGS